MVIDNNRWQSVSINRLILIIYEQSITRMLWLLIIIDYQYQSIIDRNRSINILTDCYQHSISITCVLTTTASQVSWIFTVNSKLNRSSLYYWQRDMLIVLIICAVFHGATSMNNSQTLLLRFKNNIRSALPRYLKIRRLEFSANRWQSVKFATT